jgi:hypothetical protein
MAEQGPHIIRKNSASAVTIEPPVECRPAADDADRIGPPANQALRGSARPPKFLSPLFAQQYRDAGSLVLAAVTADISFAGHHFIMANRYLCKPHR